MAGSHVAAAERPRPIWTAPLLGKFGHAFPVIVDCHHLRRPAMVPFLDNGVARVRRAALHSMGDRAFGFVGRQPYTAGIDDQRTILELDAPLQMTVPAQNKAGGNGSRTRSHLFDRSPPQSVF